MDVKVLKEHTHNKYKLVPGTIVTVPKGVGQQWIQNGIAALLPKKASKAQKAEKSKDGTAKPE